MEEFDKEKTKVLKYILYKRRSEQEIRRKFASTIREDLLSDIISYLKEANYIDDKELIKRNIENFMKLKNLSIKELQYKLMAKGCNKNEVEDYIYEKKEELEQYEKKSIQNLIHKKRTEMELQEIKQYLLRKGYQLENINRVTKGEE